MMYSPHTKTGMKNSKIKKILSSFILLAYFTTQTIAIGGMVLCEGSDGHSAIEFANGGDCAELPFSESNGHKHSDDSGQSVIQCELSHCGDCEDIPLSFVAGNERLQKSITLLNPSAQRAPPPFFAIHNQQSQFVAVSLPRRTPFNNFPSLLRTTVLLI
jgi:hypothetical protein